MIPWTAKFTLILLHFITLQEQDTNRPRLFAMSMSSPNGVLPEFVLTVASALMYHPEVSIFLFPESITGGC